MGIALLLLGLLPLAFLPDFLDTDSDDDRASEPPPINDDAAGETGSLLDGFDEDLPPEDEAGPVDELEGDILEPVIEDDLPGDGEDPDPEDVLAPVIEDDVATPPDVDEGDVLLPVDQIESDADAIWINFNDDAGLGYSEIADFQAGQDVLHVLIEPDAVIGQLDVDVDVVKSESGLDSLVYVEQQLVAVLVNSPDVTLADVIVETGVIAA